MATEPSSDKEASKVDIGNVEGGVHGSTFAGRDIIQKITNIFTAPRSATCSTQEEVMSSLGI